jgi:hypothetical protein
MELATPRIIDGHAFDNMHSQFGVGPASYRRVVERIGNPVSVLYPCCGSDRAPSAVFDRVTYVEVDGVIEIMTRGGDGRITSIQPPEDKRAPHNGIETFKPTEGYDMVLLINHTVRWQHSVQHLKKGGYVVTNGFYGEIDELQKEPGFTLIETLEFLSIFKKTD